MSCNTDLPLLMRERAKNLIVTIISGKPKKVKAHNLVADILTASLKLVIEADPEDEDEEEDSILYPHKMACEMIDMLTAYLEPEPIYAQLAANAVRVQTIACY